MMRIGLVVAGLVSVVVVDVVRGEAAAPPVVAGYSALQRSGKVDVELQGEVLLSELNCVACHAAPEGSRVAAKGGPDLTLIGARATPQWLTEYLTNPHHAKSGTTMPDLFHASAPQAKAGAVEFLTHFLVSQG